MRHAIIIFSLAMAFILGGCGGKTPEPKTAQDELSGKRGQKNGGLVTAPKREVSQEASKDFAEAAKSFQMAQKTGLNKSNCAEVAGAFGRVYESHPKVLEAKFNEGVVWEECGDLAKAEQIYNALLNKHPNYGPALNNLGEIFFSRGNVGQAITFFQRAAENKNSEGFANQAVVQRTQAMNDPNRVAEAINNVHRALAMDSYNIEAYGTMALLLYDHARTPSQLEMARLICVQATKVSDRYSPIYNTLGLVLLKMDKVTPALAEFRKAVSIDPNFLEAHMNIGAVTLSFRDYKSAEESFSKVLTLNPSKKTKVEALVGLGVAYRGQSKYKEAMQKYEEARKLEPGNVDIIYNMGILIQDYTFDASNPGIGIAGLQTAVNYLQQYASSGKNQEKIKDANKRIKNINEMIPMLKEQQKMVPQPAPQAAPKGPAKKKG
jgi:tetratricopeptide (TPR) repeat protein